MAKATYLRGIRESVKMVSAGAITIDTIIPVDNNLLMAFTEAGGAGEDVVTYATGVYSMAKVAGRVINAGEQVLWVSASELVDNNAQTPSAGDIKGFGIAVANAAAADSHVQVMLTPSAGTKS